MAASNSKGHASGVQRAYTGAHCFTPTAKVSPGGYRPVVDPARPL